MRESEDAIGRDLALQSDLASERVAVWRCYDDRLVLLRSAILRSGSHWNTVLPPVTDGFAFSEPYAVHVRLWNTQLWDSLVADGTVPHFNTERARNYALLYYTVRLIGQDNQVEYGSETALNILADKDVPLSGDAKVGLVRVIDELRNKNRLMASTSRQLLRRIQDSGHLPPLEETVRRLRDSTSRAMTCAYAKAALEDRVAKSWFTLHR